LAGWFDVLHPIARGTAPVFGMPPAPPVTAQAAERTSQEPGQVPWATEPGKLDGILQVGNGPRQALFQEQLYQVGDRIRGTTFTITSIDEDSVTLKSGDHVIRRLWHD
jgi:hypothetical protein